MEEEKFIEDLLDIENDEDLEMAETNLEAVENDLKTFEKNLESEKTGQKRYKEQYELAKECRELIEAGFKKIPESITFEFEKNPRYWEIRTEEQKYKHQQEEHLDQSKLAQYAFSIEKLTEAVEKHKAKKKVLEDAIKAYKGD